MKVIEFMGTPRSGKTTQIKRFKKKGVVVIEDREIEKEIFVPLSESFEYNIHFFNKVYEKLLLAKHSGVKTVFLDRGFYDAIAWFMVEHKQGKLTDAELEVAKTYFSHLQSYVDRVVFMDVDIHTSLKRDKTSGAKVTECSEYVFTNSYLSDLFTVYKELEKQHQDNFNMLILDGSKSVEEASEKIDYFLSLT